MQGGMDAVVEAVPVPPADVPDFEAAQDWYEQSEPMPTSGLDQREQPARREPRVAGEEDGEDAAKSDEPKVDEYGEPIEPLRALYFVRIPRPDNDDHSVQLIQQEFEMHLTTVKLLDESRRMKRLEKTDARNNTMKALDSLKAANDLVKQQINELAPFRKESRQRNNARSALMDSKRSLEATSEKDLDKIIATLEYELEHETLSLKTEKDHIAQLKRLRAQRKQVKAFEAQNQDFLVRKEQSEVVKGDQKQLEAQLKIYKEEQAEYERVFKELKAIEQELGKELTEINEECEVAVQAKNRIYEKLKGARDARRAKGNDFGENREFSRRVRELVASGGIPAAQDLCRDQVERMMTKLNTDKEYRAEYLRLWETQRKPPISFMVDDAGADKVKPKAQKPKKVDSIHGNVKLEPGQSLADAVVARVLREANGEAAPAPVARAPKRTSLPAKPVIVVEDAPVETTSQAKAEKKAAPKKTKKVIDQGDFELPEVVIKEVLNKTAKEKMNAVVKKTDTTSRKEQRKDQASKRRMKKLEEMKMREAEEKKAKEEAEKAAREAQLKQMQAKSLARQNEAKQEKENEPSVTITKREISIPDPVVRKAGGKSKKAFGRRPPKAKTTSQNVMDLAQSYPVHLSIAGVSILLLLVVGLYMTA
ncbi:hypothetical protein BSKO_12704 [Bryopsis sp. KO-2023]|nr:hypothetical protein BSKO_12704 [Bryopsis sp. KO-2023]